MADPVSSAMASVFGSVGSGIVNNLIGQDNAEKSFARQKELMALQNQYSVQNWNRENRYNTPAEQMKRLKEAGLNPDLMYGNGAAGLQAGSIASPTAPAAPMAQTVPFGNPVSDAVEAALGVQNAKKAGSEKIAKDIENEYNSKTLQNRIDATGLANDWTKEQISKTKNETAYLEQEFQYLTGTLNLMHLTEEQKEKELAQMDERFKKEMREYDDRHKISYQEERRLRETYDDFKRQVKANADSLELHLAIDKSFEATERSLGVVGQFLKILRIILR